MRDFMLMVVDDEIIVKRLGSRFSATFCKPDNSAQLRATLSNRTGLRMPTSFAEFLEDAAALANKKAKELGWIV